MAKPEKRIVNKVFRRPKRSLIIPRGICVSRVPAENAGMMMDTAVKSIPERKANTGKLLFNDALSTPKVNGSKKATQAMRLTFENLLSVPRNDVFSESSCSKLISNKENS